MKHDDYLVFRDTLEEQGALSRSIALCITAADPVVNA
jgi:V/A-type H+-transporting ATPase subunit B